MKNDIAFVQEDYLKLKRNWAGTERTQMMELLTIAHIDPEDKLPTKKWKHDDLMVVEVPKEELIRWGVCRDGDNFTHDVLRLHGQLCKLLLARSTKDSAESVVVFPKVKYVPDLGSVVVYVMPDFAPYLTELSCQYTQLQLDHILNSLQDFWTRKMYMIFLNELYSTSDITTFTITPDQLQKQLGSSMIWNNLNRRVIKSSIKEINQANLEIKIDPPKYKRAYKKGVVSITFTVWRNKEKNTQPELPISPKLSNLSLELINNLESVGFAKSQFFKIENLVEQYSSEVVHEAVLAFIQDTKGYPPEVNLGGVLSSQIDKYIVFSMTKIEQKKYSLSSTDDRRLRDIFAKRQKENKLSDPNMSYQEFKKKYIDLKAKKLSLDAGKM